MAECKDCFIKYLDKADTGILAKIKQLNLILQRIDNQIWQALENIKLHPQFYSLRWIMLIFAQEFEIFDVVRIWDSLLSHCNFQDFLYCLCLAILILRKEVILQQDFSDIMESLQRIQDLDVVEIISIADQLYKQYFE
ncbi:TBC domain protein [Ichthyophthirius multifiliis]|uniref:TBC domain protein n=1 Tax=Ichthyophthirius multifiliis TaxID=5932 RepID=G0QRY4_ICHMU|nr:TBC domain protein [Ichthyophthirius multifiliis]EGR32014.1 TBC domain protein [Ichthyophthirius multifiliis]|eukprot:XP_004035500.1 TBC domain protein [Ichthyophthirius multifiliis]